MKTSNPTGSNVVDTGCYLPSEDEIAQVAALIKARNIAAMRDIEGHAVRRTGRPVGPRTGHVVRKAIGAT